MQNINERLIKSKKRVQKHGEVFTPSWMVEMMLNSEGVKEACNSLDSTFLEPAAGEGNFLVAILDRKLNMVKEQFSKTLLQYEHYSLFALTTIYAIELLDDNAQMAVMNMFQKYLTHYLRMAQLFNEAPKNNVIDSAKVIIKANIQQGDFLKRTTSTGDPIVFSEWIPNSLSTEKISVNRTEYTLDEIYGGVNKNHGTMHNPFEKPTEQLSLFDSDDFSSEENQLKLVSNSYAEVLISNVYTEEMIVDDGQDDN